MEVIKMRVVIKLLVFVLCFVSSSVSMAGGTQNEITISPERQREFLIERDLGKAVMSWLADNNAPAALECDKLVDKLLAVREPTARTYFLEAQVANLRQNPKKTISALEKAIEKYPNEIAPNMTFPIRIIGRFWIGTIARHSGDWTQAQKMYESILNEPNSLEGKEIYSMVSNLYLAEIYSDQLKNNKEALSKLNSCKSIPKLSEQRAEQYDFYSTWSQYKLNEISQGNEQAIKKINPNTTEVFSNYMWIVYHLELVGIVASPLAGCCGSDRRKEEIGRTIYDRILQSGKSSIDESIVRFIYGFVYQQNKKYSDAEKYYSQLFNKETFLSPIAGIYLAQCKKIQNKTDDANNVLDQVIKKYPGYESAVTPVRKFWQQ
jgi:tetratricopeptide (TPR) repeat protein